MVKISVIIPVYNVECYLRQCVESILKQTFPDFELILVNDGSKDQSGNICDEYAASDSRVKVIHQGNQGAAVARNTGIEWAFENSESEWIAFIDSDDYISETYLEYLLRGCEENQTKISTCSFVSFSGDGVEQESVENIGFSVQTSEKAFCSGSVTFGPCAKLFRKELFLDIRFPAGWKISEDVATIYKALFSCEKLAITDAVLYYYRENQTSLTHSKWDDSKMVRLIAGEETLAFFKNRYPDAYKKYHEYYMEVLSIFLHWQETDCPEDRKNHIILLKTIRRHVGTYCRFYQVKKMDWYKKNIPISDYTVFEKFQLGIDSLMRKVMLK